LLMANVFLMVDNYLKRGAIYCPKEFGHLFAWQ
jgi:hypothetical protein